MKNFLNIILLASFSMAGCYSTSQVAQREAYGYSANSGSDEINYQTFYNDLQPYGNWINSPDYGNVWQPDVQQGFRPYETGGHWVSTVDGWAWASDYNWGWAPFHYGRWFFDQSIGWAWVPGYDWAPAWVTWGQYNDYYAWAPLSPGINISYGNEWRAPGNYWSFVPRNCINYSNLNRYASYGNSSTNVNNITIINNYNSYNNKDYYHRGPDYQEVQRFTHKPITPVAIASSGKPGLSRVVNRQFQVYRPVVSANAANNNLSGDGKLQNGTRTYQGGVRGDGQPQNGLNENINRIRKNPNLNNIPPANNGAAIINGGNNSINNASREDIDNLNRRFQQQQMEDVRRFRAPVLSGQPAPSQSPAAVPQQQNNQQGQQPDLRRPDVRNTPPVENAQPPRPQRNLQEERMMQRPAFPQQNERIMRQPPAPVMPQRIEANPGRSMQMERRGNAMQRPSRF